MHSKKKLQQILKSYCTDFSIIYIKSNLRQINISFERECIRKNNNLVLLLKQTSPQINCFHMKCPQNTSI